VSAPLTDTIYTRAGTHQLGLFDWLADWLGSELLAIKPIEIAWKQFRVRSRTPLWIMRWKLAPWLGGGGAKVGGVLRKSWSLQLHAELDDPPSQFSQLGITSLSPSWLIISLRDDVAWLYAFRPDKQRHVLLRFLFIPHFVCKWFTLRWSGWQSMGNHKHGGNTQQNGKEYSPDR